MADDPSDIEGAGGGDDVGWWNCSLCTYKNSADKFKCEICDLRRGTSTRKPRCSTDTIVAQVMKQQEQIRQQTRAKPSPKNKTGTSTPSLGSSQPSTNDSSKANKRPNPSRTSTPSVSHESGPKKASRAKNNDAESSSELDESSESEDLSDGRNSPMETSSKSKKRAPKRKKAASTSGKNSSSSKKSRAGKSNSNNNPREGSESEDDEDDDSDSTSVASDALPDDLSPRTRGPASESSLDDRSPYSSSSTMTPEPTTSSPNHPTSIASKQLQDNPFKNRPIEINGNLIKYSPPTSTGRTGLIIDKKRFTQHSVTVDDVTITFTEFATRQNKYIRKKKKRSRTKAAPAAASGVATTAAD